MFKYIAKLILNVKTISTWPGLNLKPLDVKSDILTIGPQSLIDYKHIFMLGRFHDLDNLKITLKV